MENQDKQFRLTKYSILIAVCEDYNIDVSHLTPKMAEHFFDDLMEQLCKQGYAERADDLD